MYGSEFFNSSLWWICPIVMLIMCFFMMRGRRGAMTCGFGSRDKDSHHISTSDSARDTQYLINEFRSGNFSFKIPEKNLWSNLCPQIKKGSLR